LSRVECSELSSVSANVAVAIFRVDVWWLDSSPLFRSTNQHHFLLAAYCLPYIRLRNTPNHHTFTLTMATAVFAETLDNFQNSTPLNPEKSKLHITVLSG
jgi:hypothetical protein